ncbi:wax ester/triacylglycerol synthase domain-containing protein [Pseudarthrobacter sp. DSP2-3-2b1]|uniref:wax ester/triacylglycerol synthase domain-containing protein n=1 Tax=Pseudarthrobacter sp. DSP2-3-2b1 TaxID=2804661 RepID=UPI003CF3ADA6
MERITAEDRLTLWPDELWPQDVGALAVIDGAAFLGADGGFRLAAAREAVQRRLHLLPRFRQLLFTPARGLGWPVWVDDHRFSIEHHVNIAPVPAPGDEAQLLETVERLRRCRLDRDRPLWEMWFLPGLPQARVGLFIRLHHVVADGMAGVADLAAFLDVSPSAEPPDSPPWSPAALPFGRDLIIDNLRRSAAGLTHSLTSIADPVGVLRRARTAWPSLRELLAEEPGPRTSLNRVTGADRRFGLLRADLEPVRRIAHANGATINDVLLTITAGGLRGLLQSRGEPVQGVALPVYVPVSLRTTQGAPKVGGNLITQMVVRLPVSPGDPVLKLRHIAAETGRRKAMARPSLGTTFRSRLVGAVLLRLIIRQRINLETADLPGPQRQLYFAGSPLLEVFPLLNLTGNVSLGVGAMSYAGQFNVMVVADGTGYPDLSEFIAAARTELRVLLAAAA